ncbi:GntR family transcriptional regulator [Alicyclobacillus vulcanalis]|uniref:Transcriptional regulator, GntR family n=2 Tax=Alicyclobacillus TaxID=29330 RepID=A0A1N7LMH8_9BACL|nr:GntR family transcriptional regulator [Alicyclobacillus vulcanalis]SIS74994.1 transcriptional regulator, GntR family [Alicyclobacillus vulcanalis]
MASPAKYVMVKEQIREWIRTGKVKPGQKIYSENELIKMFRVSRHTIRQAVGDLVHEGLLYREQGAGTFCAFPQEERLPGEPQEARKYIGVITTYISDYIFPTIIRGIESYVTNKGYSLILACTYNNLAKEAQCLESILQRPIAGLIVEPTESSTYNPNIRYYLELEQRKIPYVMINQYYPQLDPPHLIMDDKKGGWLATRHVLELSHRKLMGVFKTDDLQGVYRMQGFMDACREAGVSVKPEWLITYRTEDLDEEVVRRVRSALEREDDRPTAMVCYNDQLAVRVLDVLRELGLRVPEDISLVGYDDSYLAEATEIKLTTVEHPKTQMGLDAAKWVMRAIERGKRDGEEPASIVYEPKLIVRSSTAPLAVASAP